MAGSLPTPDLAEKDLGEWNIRLTTLTHYLSALSKMYIQEADKFGNPHAEEILKASLGRLSEFGTAIFNFVSNGILGSHGYTFADLNNDEAQITNAAKLHSIVDQITSDLVVIERILFQRIVAGLRDDARNTTNQNHYKPIAGAFLSKTDALAWNCMEHFKKNMVKDSTVLTYIHQSARIRTIPYAPVAFIGLPISAVSVEEAFQEKPKSFAGTEHFDRAVLAIPHEFGHFLYWNGRHDSQNSSRAEALGDELPYLRTFLRRELDEQQMPTYIEDWLEEIFADVVGCIIGGPLVGYSIQDLLLTASGEQFFTNDGIHPPPIMRPYVYFRTLLKLGLPRNELKLLETAWRNKLKHHLKFSLEAKEPDKWSTHQFRITEFHMRGERTLKIETTLYLERIFKVVDIILDVVTHSNALDEPQGSSKSTTVQGISEPWSTIKDGSGNPTLIYREYEIKEQEIRKRFEQHTKSLSNSSVVDKWKEIQWADLIKNVIPDIELALTGQDNDHISKKSVDFLHKFVNDPNAFSSGTQNSITLPPELWREIIWFRGWASGPIKPGITPGHPHLHAPKE